jgi:hypothetical protein
MPSPTQLVSLLCPQRSAAFFCSAHPFGFLCGINLHADCVIFPSFLALSMLFSLTIVVLFWSKHYFVSQHVIVHCVLAFVARAVPTGAGVSSGFICFS